MNFSASQTCINLMRAFAGECQARTRYTLAAKAAKQQYPVLQQLFQFTAKQELTHAQLYWECLQKHGVTNVEIQAGYPVDPPNDLLALLENAQQNEHSEFDDIYPAFAQTAAAEGFEREAFLFRSIAAIEQSHADRFALFARLMREQRLLRSEQPTVWLCLNCGHLHEGTEPPTECPVCGAVQGFAVRQCLAPFTKAVAQPPSACM